MIVCSIVEGTSISSLSAHTKEQKWKRPLKHISIRACIERRFLIAAVHSSSCLERFLDVIFVRPLLLSHIMISPVGKPIIASLVWGVLIIKNAINVNSIFRCFQCNSKISPWNHDKHEKPHIPIRWLLLDQTRKTYDLPYWNLPLINLFAAGSWLDMKITRLAMLIISLLSIFLTALTSDNLPPAFFWHALFDSYIFLTGGVIAHSYFLSQFNRLWLVALGEYSQACVWERLMPVYLEFLNSWQHLVQLHCVLRIWPYWQ